jgi:hypothetical protein
VIPVAALYVMHDGPYPTLLQDWYDERRDAKRYSGELPVVAHPPCGPWGQLRHLCKYQDPECGLRAVEQVRRVGGVLEHPRYSKLFAACGVPLPGDPPDAWGGRTYYVEQVAWGHVCRKPTWLYVVGVPDEIVRAGIKTGGAPTRVVTRGPRMGALKVATKFARTATPPAFAVWLVSLALWAAHGRGLA